MNMLTEALNPREDMAATTVVACGGGTAGGEWWHLAHFFLEDGDGVEEALPLLRLPRERKIRENA
jgi:hypothetical protein